MGRGIALLLGIGWLCSGLGAFAAPRRPAHTYSIVARDPATGQMGVAVQSHWFSVGTIVAWGEAGVGVVATQSFAEPAYGPLGLALLRAGFPAPRALQGLLGADPHPEVRQVAMLDREGRVAVHTGEGCIPAAGHEIGEGFAVQANLVRSSGVWSAMADAFRSAQGELAERLLAALEAAEAAGGDVRGRQSAALLVVAAEASGRPWENRIVDLRVEDHADPVGELRRLLRVHRAYRRMNEGDRALEAGDVAGALEAYAGAERLLPENVEVRFWHAVTLANLGRLEEALARFGEIFARDTAWRSLAARLVPLGLLRVDDAAWKRIEAAGR